jgi:hypothetical protein
MIQKETFLEYSMDLKGFRVFKEVYYNGFKKVIEKPKSELYWSGVSLKEIYTNPSYKIEKR